MENTQKRTGSLSSSPARPFIGADTSLSYSYVPSSQRVAHPLVSAGAARAHAARQLVEVHVCLPALCDRRRRVTAKPAADLVGDDAKALAEPKTSVQESRPAVCDTAEEGAAARGQGGGGGGKRGAAGRERESGGEVGLACRGRRRRGGVVSRQWVSAESVSWEWSRVGVSHL